jgi:membrane protease YdiL (CAAX protease family)
MERPASFDRLSPFRRLRLSADAARAVGFALLLVAYGNLVSAFPQALADHDWAFILANLTFMLAAVVWARRSAGLTLADVGITFAGARRGAVVGLGIAAVVILPVVLYFAFPVGLPGGSIDYERVEGLSLGSFLLWALLRQPLGVSIFEETVFRGVLQSLSIRAYGLWRGVLLGAVAFALWHLVINFQTVRDTSAGESVALTIMAQVASMLGLILGAIFMSVLRLRTGSLAAPIAFHWLVVVAMHGTLFGLAS